MKTYLIAYYDNYNGVYQGRSRTLESYLKQSVQWAKLFSTVWIVNSDLTKEKILQNINDVLGDSSPYFKIFITEISSSSYTTSGFYSDINKWLEINIK